MLAILLPFFVHAQDADGRLIAAVYSGYQTEDFHWSIAGTINGTNPNVYSELKWKKVGGAVLGAEASFKIWRQLSVTGAYSRSFTSSGTVNDTDYGMDNRYGPVYNGNFSSDKGYTEAWRLGLAYNVFDNRWINIIPGAGYGINRQDLYLVDHTGQFSNLNSSYATKWQGLYVSALVIVKPVKRISASAWARYNQVNYNAAADWNLITQFQHPVSYRHTASGYGVETGGLISVKIINHLKFNLGASYFSWQTGNGTDQLYLTDGQVDKTQLNEVVRHGLRGTAGLMVVF